MEVGIQTGIFKKHGVEIETITLAGGAKVHQAMVAGSLDIGLGSGPDWGFLAKGAPEKGVGQMAGPLLNIAVTVRNDGSIKSIADLKGKNIGVTTAGSLTDWCARELSRRQGWGSDGMNVVGLGSPNGMVSALMAKNVDAMSISVETSLDLESKGQAKMLVNFGDTIKTFITHVIFATDDMMNKRPDQLRGFLRGLVRDHRLYAREQGRNDFASRGRSPTPRRSWRSASTTSRCRCFRPTGISTARR